MADIDTTYLDEDTDSIKAARPALLEVVQRVNSLATAVGAALVGWDNGGTPITVEEGFDLLYYGIADIRNPLYAGGAVGGGVVDDTAAIQAAINTGRVVYAPNGTYKHTGLAAPNGLILIGDGENKTTLTRSAGAPNILVAPSVSGKVYRISDMSLTGGTAGIEYSTAGGAGFIDRSSYVRNLYIATCSDAGIKNVLGMIGTNNSSIVFENTGNYGLYSLGSALLNSSAWDSVRVIGSLVSGIYLKETSGQIQPNVTFTNLICEYNRKSGFTSYSVQSVLINPHFEQNGIDGNGTTTLYPDIVGDGNGSLTNQIHTIGGAFSTAHVNQANVRLILNATQQSIIFDGTYFAVGDIVDCASKGTSFLSIFGRQPTIKNPFQNIVKSDSTGFTSGQSGTAINNNTGGTIGAWGHLVRAVSKYTLGSAAFTAGGTTQDFTTFILPAKTKVVGVIMDVTQAFAGAGWATATLAFGKSIGGAQYLLAFDCKTAAVVKGLADADLGASISRANAVQGGDIASWTATVNTNVRLTVTGGVVGGITTGSVDIYIITEKIA